MMPRLKLPNNSNVTFHEDGAITVFLSWQCLFKPLFRGC